MPKGLWNAPSLPQYLVERTAELEKLHALLQGTENAALSQALKGLGGIGKTTLARHYAEQYAAEYGSVLWFNASRDTTLDADFQKLAQEVKSPNWNSQNAQEIRQGVRTYLEKYASQTANTPLLLIFDNVDEPNVVAGYVPKPGRAKILVTSRLHDLRPLVKHANVYELGVYTPEEALDYFVQADCLDMADAANVANARAVAEMLGHLPLAIEQAAGYIGSDSPPLPFATYRKEYDAKHLGLLEEGRLLNNVYFDTVLTTWAINFQKIEGTPAAEILRYCAFLAPDNIPVEVFIKDGNAAILGAPLQAELEEIAGDPAQFRRRCQPAINLSLLRYTGAEPDSKTGDIPSEMQRNTLSLHRLVQEVIRHNLAQPRTAEETVDQAKAYRNGYLERTCTALANTWAGHAANYSAANRRLAPHWRSCLDTCAASEYGLKTTDVARLYSQSASLLQVQALYEEAIGQIQQSKAILLAVVGREHPETATTLHDLAQLYANQGKYAEAEPLYQEALAIYDNVIGREHPSTAAILHALAQLYANQGKYAEAEELYKESLAIKVKVIGREHPSTAITLHALAQLYANQGKYAEAKPLYQEALAIKVKVIGREHPSTAATLHNLAQLYANQGKYAEAEELSTEAYQIMVKFVGEDHPNTQIVKESLDMIRLLRD